MLKDCTLLSGNSPGVSVAKEAHVHSTHSAPTNPHPRAVPMPMHISGQVHHLDGISEGRHSERIAPGPVSLFPNRSTGESPGTGVTTEALPDTEDVSCVDVNQCRQCPVNCFRRLITLFRYLPQMCYPAPSAFRCESSPPKAGFPRHSCRSDHSGCYDMPSFGLARPRPTAMVCQCQCLPQLQRWDRSAPGV